MKKITDTLVIFGPCRLSYLSVFSPRLNNMNGKEEYSAVLLIPKEPTEFCKDPKAVGKFVTEAIKAALAEKFGKEPPKWSNPLKDGDTETNNDNQPKHPGYWFLPVSAKAEYPPVLIDGKRNTAKPEHGWVSGDWGVVKVNFFAYEFEGKKGVSAGLRALQFLYKDEPFGSASSPEAVAAEFDEVDDAAAPELVTAGSASYDPWAD